MNNDSPDKNTAWRLLRKWIVPAVAFLVMAGAMLYLFLGLRETVWCYFTDDISIRENALGSNVRMILWDDPYRARGAAAESFSVHRPAFTPDGATMIQTAKATADTNADLVASTWDGRGWSEPARLESVNTDLNEKDAALSRDGRYLYFASDRPGGFGGYDIWVARWDGRTWMGVTNAGPAVNTKHDDVSPAVSPDGARLFFSSRRPLEDMEIKVRSGLFGGPAADAGFDIFVADIVMPPATNDAGLAGANVSNAIPAVAAAAVPGPAAKQKTAEKAKPVAKQKAAAKAKPVAKEKKGKTAAVARPAAGVVPPMPEFANAIRMDILNSPADDLNASFTDRGDFLYFDSNRKAGSGGYDVYWSRVINGELHPPKNLGMEINSPADETGSTLRQEGFDQYFGSDRGVEGMGKTILLSSTAREVVVRLDLSRLDTLLEKLLRAKWWILAFIVALILLIYLIRHYRDLTDLFHKCVMGSAIVHVALLLILSTWKIGSQLAQDDGGAPTTTTVEIAINADGLPREKLALDMAENVTRLPASDVTVIAKPADHFMPLPDFVPQKRSVETVVARSTVMPVVLENAPSRGQETSAGIKEDTEVKPVTKLDKLPEIEAPRVDVVMETQVASSAAKGAKPDVAFTPVMNAPTVSAARVEFPGITGLVQSLKPVTVLVGAGEVGTVTTTGPGGKSLVVTGTGAGEDGLDAFDTGGSKTRLSRGDDVSSGPNELRGPGEVVSGRLASYGNDDVFRMNAPGKFDVPEGYGDKMSPYMLRKEGKPSAEVVEGLGGSRETESAVGRALEWLAKNQEADGHWDIAKFGGQNGHDSAATGFSLLAFLGWGVKHNQAGSKYQPVVAKALEWLVKHAGNDGDIRGPGGNMYDQGIASIAVAEAYGLTKDPKLAPVVSNLVHFIVKAQNKKTGGWRYTPGEAGDTSVFGWQVMALKSAQMSGVEVPEETFVLAELWLRETGGGERSGLYGYTGKSPAPAMAAEGMFCRQLLGTGPEDERMQETAGYINVNIPVGNVADYYYWYYGTLSMYQHQGPVWEAWNKRVRNILVASQNKDGDHPGSWNPTGTHGGPMGRIVSTSMGALVLEVYYRYLPMYGSSSKGSAVSNSVPAAPATSSKPSAKRGKAGKK